MNNMDFKWVQRSTKNYEMQRWSLVYKGSKRVVLDMWFSPYAEHRRNHKLRKKIQRAYELYYQVVWFKAYRFF